MAKLMQLVPHDDKVDLSIERDAGNKVLILMGARRFALHNWGMLLIHCLSAINRLRGEDDTDVLPTVDMAMASRHMYQALKMTEKWIAPELYDGTGKAIRNAIAKAEGRA